MLKSVFELLDIGMDTLISLTEVLFSYYVQEEEDGGHMDLDVQRKGKSAVIKTSTRQVATPMGFLISRHFLVYSPRHTSYQ